MSSSPQHLLKVIHLHMQIGLLQTDHNPDIMLLAARSLTFLADVLPTCCGTIVRHGAVPALCERLLNIEYIDLAEQSLQVCPNFQSCTRSKYLQLRAKVALA